MVVKKKKIGKKAKISSKKVMLKAVKSRTKIVKAKPVASKVKNTKVVALKVTPKAIGRITKVLSKGELYGVIADSIGLHRKQVAAVFDKLAEAIAMHLKKDGPKKFVLPNLLKIVVKNVPARPAREGKNPFTGEFMTFKAKPASRKVKVLALKNLKSMC